LAIPPLLVCVVATPFWFLCDFQAVPVLELYPPASSPLLHTTRPRSLVTQLANALEANIISVKTITEIRIAISLCKNIEKVCGVPRLIENTTRNSTSCYAFKDWQRQVVDNEVNRRQSCPTNFIVGLPSAHRQGR
jgi:hypothetical protein